MLEGRRYDQRGHEMIYARLPEGLVPVPGWVRLC